MPDLLLPEHSHELPLVYLVDDQPLQARTLATQIGYFGYRVKTIHELEGLEPALHLAMPDVIIMDIIFPEGDLAGTQTIQRLYCSMPFFPPVIFVSASADLSARLEAVRAGGLAYFQKPVNVPALVDALERFIRSGPPEPYRVLIVDDSKIQAITNALPLQKAGMEVNILENPRLILHTLEELNPELILMDMYLDEYNGVELAAILRQEEAYLSVPIVYLSSETDPEKQLEAVGVGGDDFLVKPIHPNHLVTAVTSRIDRYRQLRKLMYSDSLTGLLNHVTIKDRLGKEVKRASRQNEHLAFAMIDLDHLKEINDSYGHAAGDRVLKSLAYLLQRRLRASDMIGRYGGDEFAIVLSTASCDLAYHVLEEIRANFAQIQYRVQDMVFSATLSCGLACYPTFQDAEILQLAADQALYKAKKNRNKIEFARHPVPQRTYRGKR